MKTEKPTENKININEALSHCPGMSCGFCLFCEDKKQDKFVDRKDGVRSYKPWRGNCHRYPPTVITDTNGNPYFVRPSVYLTDWCGEFKQIV
jgi:hypothetical protein